MIIDSNNTKYDVIDNIEQIIPSVVDKYWCYNLNKEKPSEVSIFTENQYYWRNSTGVLFYRAPLEIDNQSTQTSHAEAFFYCLLKQIFSDAMHRAKVKKIEMDIYIPSINVGIEYDGSYYHRDKLEQDLQKNAKLNELGIYVVRIRERNCPKLTDENNAIIDCVYERDNSTIQEILSAIYRHINKNNIKIDKNILKRLMKYSPEDYDFSNENVGRCYTLRSDDPNRYSNERIKKYYSLHKEEIFNQEIWKRFYILAKSIPRMKVFDGIKDENVVKKYYEEDSKERSLPPVVDISLIDDIEYLREKYDNLIHGGFEDWFVNVLENAQNYYKNTTLTPKDKEKLGLLLNLTDTFKRMFPEHYMMLKLMKVEYHLKRILDPSLYMQDDCLIANEQTSNFMKKDVSNNPLQTKSLDKKAFANQWDINIKDFYISNVSKMFSAKWYLNNIRVPTMEINEGIVRAKVTEQDNYNVVYSTIIRIETVKKTEKYKLPRKEEITFECTCNHNETPCKHIFAVLYTISDKERRGLKVFECLL